MTNSTAPSAEFHESGWQYFPRDTALLDWLKTAGPAALASRLEPRFAKWLVCEDTWFVGVNALDNDAAGNVNNSRPLRGSALDFIRREMGFGVGNLDRAQVSICYPGYPRPRQGESDAAFAFRRDRDAAHVDGLHPVGPERNRKLLETHGFILGIPVTECSANAAPLVIWPGSHRIMATMFRAALADVPTTEWPQVDLSKPYRTARQRVFETCQRVVVHAHPGAAYVLHPMLLHGVANWQEGATAAPEGRAILYFRPEISRQNWLDQAR